MEPEGVTKNAVHLFYRQPLDCIQALLSHPLLAPHISFTPWRVWTSAVKICQIYDEWLSGNHAWNIHVGLIVYFKVKADFAYRMHFLGVLWF